MNDLAKYLSKIFPKRVVMSKTLEWCLCGVFYVLFFLVLSAISYIVGIVIRYLVWGIL